MDQEQLIRNALPGARDHGEGWVTFALYAPGKKSVRLAGSFNGWDASKDELRPRDPDYWVLPRRLDRGPAEYRFVIDDELTICDPYAQAIRREGDDRPPKAVIDVGRPIYQWKHDDWQRPALRDLIIHEVHVGDFSPEGTWRGAIERLDHLKALGVNAIELLPVYEGEENDYWGYTPNYFLAPRAAYGPVEDLLRLVDECHARGIGVILDLVLTHTGPSHPFLQLHPFEDSPWYGPPIGERNQFGLPTLDYHNDATNAFAHDVQAYWLNVFHVDGFRYDYVIGLGADDEGRGLPFLMSTARHIRPEAYLIGECIPEQPDLVNDTGLGAVWHTRAKLALLAMVREGEQFDFSYDDLGKALGAFHPGDQGYDQAEFMVNYVESHDEPRLAAQLREAGLPEDVVFAKAALAFTALMTLPGEPMLYHGQEWGEDTPKKLEPNKIHWDRLGGESGRGLCAHAAGLCRMRRAHVSLRSNEFALPLVDAGRHCAVWHRRHGESDRAVVAVNFSGDAQEIDVPFPAGGQWHEHFTGEIVTIDGDLRLELEPYSARIYFSGVS